MQPMMNLADGMHPNQAGINILAKILPQVKRLLSKTVNKERTTLIVDGSMFEKSLHQGARCHKKRPVSVAVSIYLF